MSEDDYWHKNNRGLRRLFQTIIHLPPGDYTITDGQTIAQQWRSIRAQIVRMVVRIFVVTITLDITWGIVRRVGVLMVSTSDIIWNIILTLLRIELIFRHTGTRLVRSYA